MAYPAAEPDPTSVVGRRVLAILIDVILIMIPVGALVTADFQYHTAETLDRQGVTGEAFCEAAADRGDPCFDLTEAEGVEAVYFSEEWSAATSAAFWLIPFAVFVVLQGLTGWTPGKLVAGIRAVREDGERPGLVKALVRWVLWIVDAFPYCIPGLVAVITSLTTPGHRRVGDMAAKTFVVRKSAAGAPVVTPGLTPTAPLGAAPWGAVPAAVAPAPGWDVPNDPNAPGWASPGVERPTPPPAQPTPVAPAPSAEGPQWDAARGTYIQWDPAQQAWMQWDDGFKAWTRIPGQ